MHTLQQYLPPFVAHPWRTVGSTSKVQARAVAVQLQAAVVQEAPWKHQSQSPDSSHMQHLHRLCTGSSATRCIVRVPMPRGRQQMIPLLLWRRKLVSIARLMTSTTQCLLTGRPHCYHHLFDQTFDDSGAADLLACGIPPDLVYTTLHGAHDTCTWNLSATELSYCPLCYSISTSWQQEEN
jgi:hypothetical protein